MVTTKACSVATLALATTIFTALLPNPGAAIEKQAARPVSLLAGPSGPPSFIRPPTPTAPQPEAATFVVTYTGFSAAAKSAFQRAVNIWAAKVTSTCANHDFSSVRAARPNVLGQAGPNFIWHDFPGALVAGTWMSMHWLISDLVLNSTPHRI